MGLIFLDRQRFYVASHHSFGLLLPRIISKPSEPEKFSPPRDPKLLHNLGCILQFLLSKQILVIHCYLFFPKGKSVEEQRVIPTSRYWNKTTQVEPPLKPFSRVF